ncbi:hypothetical protein [Kangiella aquimarina]|uniref:Uncharacterized protein n=1 Tax=Kangiella aquimarina TaxID=261965 RepID=A0ABZ0X5D3_9GAMM|nr:hypothetical protein [Kangiella aquimarina]WQG85593.1 hypothetical protein SR900_01615 [Kangiella aquimarina]
MIFWVTLTIFGVCLILESIISWIFIKGSQKKHPDLWEHSGSPTLMGNADLISAWPLNKYLMQRDYESVQCEKAKAFATKLRLPFVVSYFSAAISSIVFIISIAVYGVPQ